MSDNEPENDMENTFPGPRIKTEITEGCLLVHCLDNNLDNEDLIELWANKIQQAIDGTPNKDVIIDFCQVQLMTSSGIRNLVMFHYKLEEQGQKLGLCCLNEDLREVFKMTCLDSLFIIGETPREVIAAFEDANKAAE